MDAETACTNSAEFAVFIFIIHTHNTVYKHCYRPIFSNLPTYFTDVP